VPILCPVGFSTLGAIGRAEAHADLEDRPVLAPNPCAHAAVEPAPTQLPPSAGPPGLVLPGRLTKNQRKNLRDRAARRALRELDGGGPKACSRRHRGLAKERPLDVDANVESDLPHSKPAWVGLRELEDDRSLYTLTELRGTFGLRLFDWDGR
jgi:hypothetical protein